MIFVFKRITALIVLFALLTGLCPGVLAEPVDASEAVSANIDPVFEEEERSLWDATVPASEDAVATDEALPDIGDILLFDSEASEPAITEPVSDAPDPEIPTIDGWENMEISEMLTVSSAQWENVNLVRTRSYEGPLAQITGKLTLKNVLIEGIPANQTDLADQFELVTRATIAIPTSARLAAKVSAISLDKGAKRTIGLTWKGKTLAGKKATWKSANKKIATVDKNGKVKGVSKGVTTITATYQKKKVSIRVVVTQPVTRITLSPSIKYLDEQTQQLFTAAIAPENPDYPTLTWKSSNEQVATVNQNGLVSGLMPGKATITATAISGKSAAVNLQVIRPATDMALDESLTLYYRKSKALTPTFTPEDASVQSCTWTTSNKKVATVSKKGVVTGVGPGVCTITATSYNGIVRQCEVTVIRTVKSIQFSQSRTTLSLNNTASLKVKFNPSNASDKSLTWSSSRPDVVSVDENGLLTGLKTGSATITACSNNGKTTQCKVTVKEYKPTSLDFTQLYITMNPGNTFEPQFKLKPSNVSNRQIIYTSSNPEVATVDESGQVTAVGLGTATITGHCAAKSSVKNTFKVCVIAPGSARMAGLVIGINPGHQTKTITKKYPIAPGSKKKGYGCKVGAVGRWTRVPEYEITLDVGLKLAEMLTEEGATVVITRTRNNVSLTNIQRANMLNDANVDVALQLHCNSSKNTKKYGLSAFYRSTGGYVAESKSLAKHLCKSISTSTGLYNKGTEVYNDYMSLNYSNTPAVLLEMGYLSNKKEDKLLSTETFRQQLAEGIRDGLISYFGR